MAARRSGSAAVGASTSLPRVPWQLETMRPQTIVAIVGILATPARAIPPGAPASPALLGGGSPRGLPVGFADEALASGFGRFSQMTDSLHNIDRLFRSSAPFYKNRDSDQLLTPRSIDFLRKRRIQLVISLNSEANNPRIASALQDAGIQYLPLPIVDYSTSTKEHLDMAFERQKELLPRGSGILVWCGYGHGRTGTMISALQIRAQREMPWSKILTMTDFKINKVETFAQKMFLNRYQADVYGVPLGFLKELLVEGEEETPPETDSETDSETVSVRGKSA